MRHIVLASAVVGLMFATATPTYAADPPSTFGRMLPGLPAGPNPPAQRFADIAQSMLDPGLDSGQLADVPSGFTYLGQFIDHDLTLDTSPPPTAPVNPTTLTNGRTFRFDLDSVYGNGPQGSPQLYQPDGRHFRVQEPNANGVRDLPRNPDGTAVLVEGRNDENEIIGQLHVAFLRLHNALIDDGNTFGQARAEVRHLYQWVVVHEYLPTVLGQARVDRFLDKGKITTPDYKPGNPPFTPVEFSVAAFRFGHSEVRACYEVSETSGCVPVFSFTEPDLRGGRDIPAGREIAWGNFFTELTDPADPDGFNHIRRVDTLISGSLFQLPIPGAEATGSNVLAFRNMTRAGFYGLPSYESVAHALGFQPVPIDLGPGFEQGTPLWYGILKESETLGNGERLGPTGGTIVAETILGVLDADPDSILHDKTFVPDPAIANVTGGPELTMSDLLVKAGVADLPETN